MVKKLDPQKHADQRTRLLAHARHLFAVQGVKETSMSQVAKACKITKATLYHYFQNKESILKEILDCRSQGIEAASQWAKAKNLEECLYQIAMSHLGQMEDAENLEVMKLMITETMKNAEMRKFYMEFLRDNLSLGAQSVAAFVPNKKSEKELKLLFFQFMSTLVHYDWNVKMVGDPSGFIGDETLFIKQLVKTYTLAFQAD
jgi:AcrR family transcriptional regulator